MTKEERLKAAKVAYPGAEYQQLFDHMSEEHGLTLLQGEMDDIIRIAKGAEAEAESNQSAINKLIEQFEDKIKSAEHLKKTSGTWGDTITSAVIERLNVRIYERKTFIDALKSLLTH